MSLVVLHTGFPGDPPDPREAASAIERLEHRRAECLFSVAVLAGCLGSAIPLAPELAVGLLAGLLVAATIAAAAHLSLRGLVDRCALFYSTDSIPSVARHQRRLLAPPRRRALASALRGLAEDSACAHVTLRGIPPQFVLSERVRAVRGEVLELAALVERVERPDPVVVARLWRLLGDGLGSPVYNPAVPADELGVILRQARLRLMHPSSELHTELPRQHAHGSTSPRRMA